MLKKIILISLFFTVSLLIFSPALVYGQASGGIIPQSGTEGCPANYEGNCGDYNLDSFVQLAVNVSRWILGIVGSLTLLMFIYGGFMFLISTGSSDKVTEARKIITAAVIGLLIVFASFLIIKFVLGSMGITWNGQQLKF